MPAVPSSGSAAAVVDELIATELAGTRTAGVAVVVTDADGVLLERYGGWSDLAARWPVDAGTVFEIGSITKVATAVLAVRLADAGRLDLHAPVRRYVPWLPEHPYGTRTAHQLLSHTAGLPAGSDLAPAGPYQALVACFPPAEPPGGFSYSDAGFQVMGMVVAAVAGRPYPELLRDAVLAPLGMASSFPVITGAARRTMATGYLGSPDDRPFAAGDGLAPAPYFDYTAADGCMACTGTDLAAFARMLATGGAGVLSPRGFELLTTPVADTGDGESVCLGVFSSDAYGYPDLNHGGNMVGYQAMLCVDRSTGLAAVALLTGVGDPVPLARGALRAARETRAGGSVTPPQPPPAPALADYAGTYGSAAGRRVLQVRDDQLVLDGRPLVWIAGDTFAVPGSPYPARFGRATDAPGSAVVELGIGAGHWTTEGYAGERDRPYPAEWDAYRGHYRSYKPFEPTFRVVVRNGTLLLVAPSGRERELEPRAGEATFAVAGSRDVLAFDTPAGPHMLRAVLSGCPYYRVEHA